MPHASPGHAHEHVDREGTLDPQSGRGFLLHALLQQALFFACRSYNEAQEQKRSSDGRNNSMETSFVSDPRVGDGTSMCDALHMHAYARGIAMGGSHNLASPV